MLSEKNENKNVNKFSNISKLSDNEKKEILNLLLDDKKFLCFKKSNFIKKINPTKKCKVTLEITPNFSISKSIL